MLSGDVLHRGVARAEDLGYLLVSNVGVAAGDSDKLARLGARQLGEPGQSAVPGGVLYAAYHVRAVGRLGVPRAGRGERLAACAVDYAHGEGRRAYVQRGGVAAESARAAYRCAVELYLTAGGGVGRYHDALAHVGREYPAGVHPLARAVGRD